MALLEKLKSKCKNCTEASIKVYYRNIKRLYKLENDKDTVPLNISWLNKKSLKDKYKELPLKVRRHLSVAAIKFLHILDKNREKSEWYKFMMEDNQKYQAQRNKGKKTSTEIENWPKHGFKTIRKMATEFWKRNKAEIMEDKKSLRKLYSYQTYIVLRMFSEIPMRNTYADLFISKKDNNNYIEVPKKGSVKLIIRSYKNSKQLGDKTIECSRGLTTQIKKFLNYRKDVVDNNYFLNTLKGEKMSRAAMGKMLRRTTLKLTRKNIGSRLIRVLAATDMKDEIEKVSKLSNSLLHTNKQTKQYVRKD